MDNNLAVKSDQDFNNDTGILQKQGLCFLEAVHPAELCVTKHDILKEAEQSSDWFSSYTFYRIANCTTDNVEDLFECLKEKMCKFYSSAYSMGNRVVYGIVSNSGKTNIVVGMENISNNKELFKGILEGVLDGAKVEPFVLPPSKNTQKTLNAGLISAMPTIKIGEEKQKFSMVPIMNSLNGQDYTLLVVARPLSRDIIRDTTQKIMNINDSCFAVSKRTMSRSQGNTETTSRTTSHTHGSSSGFAFIFSCNSSTSDTTSNSISKAINRNEEISLDVQNGVALEMMDYAERALERFRQGLNIGMWDTVISYCSESQVVRGIIEACLSAEFSKPDAKTLPMVTRQLDLSAEETQKYGMPVPAKKVGLSPLCVPLTSEELGFICTLPDTAVPDFELRKCKNYPLVSDSAKDVLVGNIYDGRRELNNMPLALSYHDLARHTFVCGITGSGKTTTVKGILKKAKTPFLVIESAKKEYRNLVLEDSSRPTVYTLGKPEINCLRFNPFYIQPGISPQLHIDFLKDLFNASFSFYGPMPYILEKCLQNVYKKKGWNLTLGFHPYLVNSNNPAKFFEADNMLEKYSVESHKYLFPTMQELKEEVCRYVEEEMNYEGEVAGNIKTAIKARLEGLCSGTKGFMFDTHEYADMRTLLAQNTVFELEGLADDSDKAFCVGLLIIFINEYRQITKETEVTHKLLSHILVIEEAHRLLKNVSTEKFSEDTGNPKGKAVEHFTNMLAEMRSYGQGVIVAEQIPSKLAADVIKNSSTKIIQRLVAADDQELVANTIGLSKEEAIYLGNLTTGVALCHKEGMNLPVMLKIPHTADTVVSDEALYAKDLTERFSMINENLLKETLYDTISLQALKMLNTIMVQGYNEVVAAINNYRDYVRSKLAKEQMKLVMAGDPETFNLLCADFLTETIVAKYLLRGVYQIKELATDEMYGAIQELLKRPSEEKTRLLKELLHKAYGDNISYKAKFFVARLVANILKKNTDVCGTIKNYFYNLTDEVANEIVEMVEEIKQNGLASNR